MREEIDMTHVGLRNAEHDARALATRVRGYVQRGEVRGWRWSMMARALRTISHRLAKMTHKEINNV